jgi:regulator of protease activity HflC (stomatin/prohibitin superfamily)
MIGFLHLVVILACLGLVAMNVARFRRQGTASSATWSPRIPGIAIGLIAAIAWAALAVPSIGTVPAGSRGVVLSFGAVTGRILRPGIYLVNPFAGESVAMMNVQTVAAAVSATAASRDLQDVAAQITVNYGLLPSEAARVYERYREEFATRVLGPAIQEAVKAATAKFDAENLIRQRSEVKEEIERILAARMQPTHRLEAMSITDFKFSQEFSNAIEAKVTATQQALKAKNDLERVKFEAEQRVTEAKGEAEAIRIQALAITQQGGSEYVALKAVEKWNGVLPVTMLPGGSVPFVPLSSNK